MNAELEECKKNYAILQNELKVTQQTCADLAAYVEGMTRRTNRQRIVIDDLLRELSNLKTAKWDEMEDYPYEPWARSRAQFAIEQAELKLKEAII